MLRLLPLLLLFSTHAFSETVSQTSAEVIANQVKNKAHKRPHPVPFARFLKNNEERSELYRLIKDARSAGAPKQEVTRRIDVFLKEHLDADDLKEVERLRIEGIKMNARYSSTTV